MRRLQDITNLEAGAKGAGEACCMSLPSAPTSAGSAAAVLENSCIAHEKCQAISIGVEKLMTGDVIHACTKNCGRLLTG